MLHNYKLYLQCLISLTWIGVAIGGPMLYVYTQLCGFSWTGYGFYVQVKGGARLVVCAEILLRMS